ncbi:class I SAM-dependent methyltransferase [Skermania sp. ID1734]|uniref:class I SAM-dependent methyltransferase n=1 Tax=Skermania sp. ID1734 TaxID=2597516 RepID=UPI00117EF117|nr:class I SAM-dependent methyltransferase [Skermania sp. ID1734]TSD99530.1 class I SAM-dependent methyltransferase [Skermania sp. ID1734]
MRPYGTITRGTTGVNRLRRSDRWLIHHPRVRKTLEFAADPLVVDLGYGAHPVTTFELAHRLRRVRRDVRVVGLEIDPERLAPPRNGVTFGLGGFELAGLRPTLVRAFNVLRQYPESEVAAAWAAMQSALHPDGLIIEGTCGELGRHCSWILLDKSGPVSLTLAWDPFSVELPSDVAQRLPKALIHRNVAGEAIHALLAAVDRAWLASAGHTAFGPRARWRETLTALHAQGIPVDLPRRRIRDCVLTVPWELVAP